MPGTVVERQQRFAEREPDDPGIMFAGAGETVTVTRGGWDRTAGAVAARLRPGSRVLVLLPSGLDFFHAFAGVLHAGACAVPALPPAGGRAQFVDIATDAEVDAVVTTRAIGREARRCWASRAVEWIELDDVDPVDWSPPA